MKKNVMVNEVMRILRNCNEYCPWEVAASHISYFMKRLQFSGYDQAFRYEVVKIALKKHHKNTGGELPNQSQANNKKRKWFQKNGEKDAVMFVQATKDEQLKKEIQQAADRNKVSLKVIEKVDKSIRKEIQRSDPFKSESCGRTDCTICELETGVNCRARGCIYEMWCKECQRKYRGQTGVSADERIGKHFEDWKRKLETCPLHRHSQLYHQGKRFPVGVKIQTM